MVSITQTHARYLTYILTDEDGQSELEVVPERGGIVTRWRVQNRELLYLDEERFANPELTVRGGIPILFPICGNLPDNTYTDNGKTYSLKQHGFARNLPWSVEQQKTDNGALLTLKLTSTDETRAVYPFDFEILFTYWLRGNTLEIIQKYTNRSQRDLPFSTGLHPYFLVNDKSRLEFDIPAQEFQDQISHEIHPFSGTFDLTQEEIDVAFKSPTALRASVTDHEQRIRISLDYGAIYSTLVFWTVQGKDYYCLEPWSAPRNALNTGEHLIRLSPDNILETRVRFVADCLNG